ncbi:Cu(I)-responsive transcriptional regulator [Uruburuella testudinis]|uniref:Cu(I)-responsive transcriptional regulator n=1 Tax=Uruburuella testudinis TaxID=1282863 RepID=A0ABY4DVM2_9NEIS|nr:Cu(I)-responsive transcriptional regulator [Uruburuella testudinis]UOO83090.1 Cu(I)-responsive transcriptional regulator [Uruburuella testudinis]
MNISETAKLTGLTSKMIRDYEHIGLISPAQRSQSGYRQYGSQDLDTLRFIKHARDVGFSLAQIQTLLNLKNSPHRTSAEVKQLVGGHLDTLHQKIARLQSMADTLQSWHDCCKGNADPDCAIIDRLSDTQNTL